MKSYSMLTLTLVALLLRLPAQSAAPATSVVDNLTFNGQVDPAQASFVLKGTLKGTSPEEQEPRLIYSLQSVAAVQVDPRAITQKVDLKARIFQGKMKELVLVMQGQGEVTAVTGTDLKDWSVRVGSAGKRFLVIRPQDQPTNAPALTNFAVVVQSRQSCQNTPTTASPLSFTPENSAFFDGFIDLQAHDSLELSVTNTTGLSLLQSDLSASATAAPVKPSPLRFRFSGADYTLAIDIREKDPDLRRVLWENFKLVGELKDQFATFVLTGQAVVKSPDGGSLVVLSGDAALADYPANTEMKYEQGRYSLRFAKPGTYPIELKFNARVTPRAGWNALNFEVVPSALCPLLLKGLSTETQFQFPGAARPERQGADFVSYLPADGKLQMQWKEARTEELGKLFYSAEGLVQLSVGPGLLRQAYVLEFKVMQGELNQIVFDVTGEGEVTRIRGEDILSWKTEPAPDNKRRLVVQLSQARKDKYSLLIQTQTPLGIFPLQIQPMRLAPAQAIRFGGHLLVNNDGAVRLEVTDSRALSQISPDLFPQSKEMAELAPPQRSQAFAYRFSGGDFSLGIQAENILPELSISQVLVYHLAETETAIDAELELDIREAPLREFSLRVPADFTVSRLTVAQLSDYSLAPEADAGWARLKILFANPLNGRQLLQLRLEKNQNAAAGAWALPVLQPQGVKAVRGYVGVSADTGFRIAPGALTGLSEIASAYFPKKIAGLQAAYRLREEAWQAKMNVERLALSIQADVTHLFTISEGIAYGSSVMNYLISGTPVSVLKIDVPPGYSNVEFAGRDLRNWKKTGNSYEVYLHTPVFGSYTLLATYDRQFGAQSNTVSFVGARPVDAQSEQGSVLVVSDYQFDVKPAEVSAGLLQLEPGEISPEHRLLFDSPLLAAYQYTARPFALQLSLQSLGLGQTVHQVVDRATLNTRISRQGEVVTEATYFLKSQGHSHFRLRFTNTIDLWEARVNGNKVVPVTDRNQTLIPLPLKADPSAVMNVQLKLAGKSPGKSNVQLAAPAVAAPVLLTEWSVQPDPGYQLQFRGGSIAPAQKDDRSGFAWLMQPGQLGERRIALLAIPVLFLIGLVLLRYATRVGVYRWSATHLIGGTAGFVACLAGVGLLVGLIVLAAQDPLPPSPTSTSSPLSRMSITPLICRSATSRLRSSASPLWMAWPALIALFLWGYLPARFEPGIGRKLGVILGWVFLAWAALRVPNGAPAFLAVVLAFVVVHLLIPSVRSQARLPRRAQPTLDPATAASALLILGLLGSLVSSTASAATPNDPLKNSVQRITQQARVQDNFIFVTAQLQWKAEPGHRLEFLSAPAVLSKIVYPQTRLQLSPNDPANQSGYRLTAREAGVFDITFEYQLSMPRDVTANNFTLPTPAALVNRLDLEVEKADVDVFSAQGVSVQTTRTKRGDTEVSRAELVLLPLAKANIAWKPRSRDTRAEKAVFYAELWHLFIPTPGVVEGVHDVQVRPAQGQLSEINLQVPPAMTVTDVQADFISGWRFDPDQRLLRVQFNAPQARPFSVRLRSQLATSPLPYQQTNGVLSLVQAAGQVGMVGVATSPEVQLDTVKEQNLSAINLEDFPAVAVAENVRQIPGLTLRRAFRYADPSSRLVLSASAVQPDVRVETQETFSLGEDRSVLADQLSVHITRAGLFKLSFVLPPEYEVESLTGPALSHWTELKVGSDRIITLHLKGKTEGDHTFSASLAGPGTANRKQWEAPRLILREANKQTGQLLVVPEVGMRLHVKTRDGLTQLDPQKIGVRQKGVMAYRLLHPRWQFSFDIETVDPWVQVASLQDATLREGQVLVTTHLDYQIENAGLKSLLVQLPASAENVRFEGDLISDTVRNPSGTNRLADWELKLQRRIIGSYALRVSYQMSVSIDAAELRIAGVQAKNSNLQRGYLAVRAAGRLQLQIPQIPSSLQRTEWQSIPASLRRGRDLTESKDTFSAVEADFELPIRLSRHEIAKVLPARVEKVDLTSVVAPSGEMLTEGRLLIWPGDKRLLRVKLPASGQFWYAFVNGQSAWPWQEGKDTLLMLEKNSDPAKPTMVEFFYTCQAGAEKARGFSHQFLGPAFDLPLENITWQVHVPESWQVRDWDSSLQFRTEDGAVAPSFVSLQSYLQSQNTRLQAKSKEAETLFNMGNEFLQKGTPQQARRAYQAAWKLSPQDAAFNEDARVQLHNLKMQQALLGLNERRQTVLDNQEKRDTKAARLPLNRLQPGQAPDYTQQQAEQVLEQVPAEDNAALGRLAERLIRQQDAGVGKPESIRATLPAQGKRLTFTGSLQVQSGADLRIKLDAKTKAPGQWVYAGLLLLGLFVCMAVIAALVRDPARAAVDY